MKTITHIIIFLVLVSCTTNEEKPEANETKNTLALTECLENFYPELSNYINEYLPPLYPKCDSFKISYRPLTRGQIDTTELSKNENIKHYLNNFEEVDGSFFNQKFYFDKLEQCSNDTTYERSNKCAFYVGGVYVSEDKSLQLIRLYQEGEIQIFDVFIKINEEDVEILAFG